MAYSPRPDDIDDERAPLLGADRAAGRSSGRSSGRLVDQLQHRLEVPRDQHAQFCMLIGVPPSNTGRSRTQADDPSVAANPTTLYSRATRKRSSQAKTYAFTAALSNTLLLSQIVLGATLTALGASESSHILITIFGVCNTVIAGLVAYLKSRGQPMRAKMFRDDLEHVVDEIENSEIMWLGITRDIHGYDEIDIDDKVSVRSEVARLTRLYESANKKYMQNNPDLYMAGGVLDAITGLRARPAAGPGGVQIPSLAPAAAGPAAGASGAGAAAAAPAAADPEESPATSNDAGKKSNGKDKAAAPAADAPAAPAADAPAAKPDAAPASAAAAPAGIPTAAAAPAQAPVAANKDDDPDAEPASALHPPKKDDDSDGSGGVNGTK